MRAVIGISAFDWPAVETAFEDVDGRVAFVDVFLQTVTQLGLGGVGVVLGVI